MIERFANALPVWMGSTTSLILHSLFFIGFFLLLIFGVELDTVLLALTTLISIEAIYLALFIQRSVNQNTITLEEVEEEIDEISEEVEDIGEDLDELEEDLDLIQKHDLAEDAEDAEREAELTKLEQDMAELKQMVTKLLEQGTTPKT